MPVAQHFHVLYNVIKGETRIALYTCCRDGEYIDTHQIKERKRARKSSRKLGKEQFCIAHITATEYLDSGKVYVKYTSTHTNHDVDLGECKHLPLPKSIFDRVRNMFSTGVTIDKVMDG